MTMSFAPISSVSSIHRVILIPPGRSTRLPRRASRKCPGMRAASIPAPGSMTPGPDELSADIDLIIFVNTTKSTKPPHVNGLQAAASANL